MASSLLMCFPEKELSLINISKNILKTSWPTLRYPICKELLFLLRVDLDCLPGLQTSKFFMRQRFSAFKIDLRGSWQDPIKEGWKIQKVFMKLSC